MGGPRISDVQRHIQSGDCTWLKDNFPKLNCNCSTGILEGIYPDLCIADTPSGNDPVLNEERKEFPEFLKIQLPTKEIWFQTRLRVNNQWFDVIIKDTNANGNPVDDEDCSSQDLI